MSLSSLAKKRPGLSGKVPFQKSKSRTGKSGVVKIVRDAYSHEARVAQQRNWFHLALDVKRRDGFKCVDCQKPEQPTLGIYHDVHHIIPLTKGGVTAMANLITLCQGDDGCHQKRHRHSLSQSKLHRPKRK